MHTILAPRGSTPQPGHRRVSRGRRAALVAVLLLAAAAFAWTRTAPAQPVGPKAQLTVGGPKIGTAVQVKPDGSTVELGGVNAPAVAALVVAVGALTFAATGRREDHAADIDWLMLVAETDRAALIDRYEAELADVREQWEMAVRANQVLWSALDEGVLP